MKVIKIYSILIFFHCIITLSLQDWLKPVFVYKKECWCSNIIYDFFLCSIAFNKGFMKNTGLSLSFQIIRALFVKKAIHTWRNRVVTLVQLLLPVIFTILGLAADESRPDANLVEPPLKLNLEPYGRTYIPFTSGLNPTQARTDFAALYKAQFGSSQVLEEFSNPPVSRA